VHPAFCAICPAIFRKEREGCNHTDRLLLGKIHLHDIGGIPRPNHDAKRAALDLDLLLILSAPLNHAGGLRAHRAQARCRVVGQEPFGYFGALFQSDPPSGGTLSGRYRSNGYLHNPTVSPVRPPSRASPLPQLDRGMSGREVSAGRPSSQASQLPQLQRGAAGR
jgi:hypothetical protein